MNLINSFVAQGKAEPFSPEEEICLLNKYYQSRDIVSRNTVLKHNLKLVFKIASDYGQQANADIISEGVIGLMRAIEKFNPNLGYRFSTFASYWIRAAMLEYILTNSHIIKHGTGANEKNIFFNLEKKKFKLTAQGIDPTLEQLSKELIVPISALEQNLLPEISLYQKEKDKFGTTGKTVIDYLSDDKDSVEELLIQKESQFHTHEQMKRFYSGLSTIDKIIFQSRIIEKNKLCEVGNKTGLCAERVRQLESKILEKLKRFSGTK